MPVISGVTRDSGGNPLTGVTVKIFRTDNDALAASGVSGVGGAYSIATPTTGPFYAVAYKTGSPDVAGTTVNSLVAGVSTVSGAGAVAGLSGGGAVGSAVGGSGSTLSGVGAVAGTAGGGGVGEAVAASTDLVLNFLTSTMDPRLTFTSSGGKTFTNSAGSTVTASANQARLDYSGGVPLGLLIDSDSTEQCYLGGSAFTDAYNSDGWTLIVEWHQATSAGQSNLWDISTPADNDLIGVFFGSSFASGFLTPGDVARINGFDGVSNNSVNKMAISLDGTGSALVLNGGEVKTATGDVRQTASDRLYIGSRRGYAYGVDGHIRKITLKNTKVTGSDLQALSA